MTTVLFETSFAPPEPNADIAPQSLCPSNVPLVLLPVRLETRFFTLAGGVTELRVRVYPDKIHIDTHQPELTTDERTWGTQYWQQDWLAGNDAVARSNAWAVLAGRFRAERAAWIARVLQPTNIQQRPAEPVPSGQQPQFPPVFPTLPPVGVNGESAWRHPPRARLLPDRWVAVVHSAGAVALTVTGRDITQPVNVGPDPAASAPDAATESAILAGDKLALDPGMMWMVDFDEAEANGMALRITIPAATLTAGLDSLVVFGVAASLGTANTAAQLADLLDAHRYTDGLEFLRFGTPTNNTDDRRTAFSTEDPGHARSFGIEVAGDPTQAPNAARLGRALGLPPDRIPLTLGRIGQAGQDHDLDLRSMNTALWQVGWGYFLTNMIGPETGLTPADVDWARGHFLDYVRAGGPLPALRAGTQPYGILPVTSLGSWAAGAGESVAPQEDWLKRLLVNMRLQIWRQVVGLVPRIGLRSPADPDGDLNDIMRSDGVSSGVVNRAALGRHLVEHLHALDAQPFGATLAAQNAVALKMMSTLPSQPAQLPRAAHLFYSDRIDPLTAPLVQTGEVSPWQVLQPNYIANLLGLPTIQSVIDARPAHGATDQYTSLLQMLLRHAMLREIATAAAKLAAALPGRNLGALLRDLELIDLVDVPVNNFIIQTPPQTLHWKRQLDLGNVPIIPAGKTIRQYLEGLQSFTTPEVTALGEFRASLAHLQSMDTESLQLLMQSTLDLSAHRLDAWVTSFATKRLALMTAGGVAGPIVGAYGWVENLKRADPLTSVPTASLPAGEAAPLGYLPKDSGFIHAPSLSHASTAALLRNAHLGPSGEPEATGPFAIDLSSRRVREAGRLLEGVRQGQPLGAVLGYHLERRLHELKLDRFIAPLRNIAPLVVRQRDDDLDAAPDALAATNVVDALVLVRRWQDDADSAVPHMLDLLKASEDERRKVSGELDAILDSVDALGDALTAEAAYQMVRGNTSRLASTLAAISQGDAVPPELEVARVPRTGTSLTHRVVVWFSGSPNVGSGWTTTTLRSTQERWLGAWVRTMLGTAERVRCTVERLDDMTGAVAETASFVLNDVPMSALDFVYNVKSAGQTTDGSTAPTISEQLVLYHARRRTGGFGATATLRLHHARPTDLAAGEITLFELLEEARAIRRLLEGVRALRPEDLVPPERSSQAVINLTDLEARVVHYEAGLNLAHVALTNAVARVTTTTAESFRTAMLALGAFSVGPFVPNIAVGDTPEIRAALAAQSAAMLKISRQRLDRDAVLRAKPVATDDRVRCDQLVERARCIYGEEFVCLPFFTCDTTAANEFNAALGGSTALQGGDPLAANGWFTRSSRVREPLARLGDCLHGSEIIASGSRLNLAIAQLPFRSGDRWVGLSPAAGKELLQNKLSLVLQLTTTAGATNNASQPVCGLLVDEWTEVVPNANETTGIAFQYDPPNAFAPQNILIAVPPVPGRDWTTETLRAVLVETLDLAKLRAVDPSLLGAAAQYLPALYVPFNTADDAVSTDFAPMTVATPPAAPFALGIDLSLLEPSSNATIGRSLTVAGTIAPISGTLDSVQIRFGVGGPTVDATIAGTSWSWRGLVPNVIRPGQSFQIIATASGVTTSPVNAQAVANVALENIVPVLAVDPSPAQVTTTQAPYVATLTGSVSEGTAAPYTTPQVRYRVGPAALTTVPVTEGRWSIPLSLPAGDSIVTIQASDAFGSITTFQKTLTVVVAPA
jgi:hypothetical protein